MSTTISRSPAAGNEALITTLRLLALLRSADKFGIRALNAELMCDEKT
jgi:hypothetical protein